MYSDCDATYSRDCANRWFYWLMCVGCWVRLACRVNHQQWVANPRTREATRIHTQSSSSLVCWWHIQVSILARLKWRLDAADTYSTHELNARDLMTAPKKTIYMLHTLVLMHLARKSQNTVIARLKCVFYYMWEHSKTRWTLYNCALASLRGTFAEWVKRLVFRVRLHVRQLLCVIRWVCVGHGGWMDYGPIEINESILRIHTGRLTTHFHGREGRRRVRAMRLRWL